MKRRFTILAATLVAALSMLLILPGASAQNSARANIPFAFSANHQVLPAGCYQVKVTWNIGLVLANCDGRNIALLMAHTGTAYGYPDHSSLLFRVTPRGYRLIQVRIARSNTETYLLVQQLRSERELARNDVSKTSKTTEIALK